MGDERPDEAAQEQQEGQTQVPETPKLVPLEAQENREPKTIVFITPTRSQQLRGLVDLFHLDDPAIRLLFRKIGKGLDQQNTKLAEADAKIKELEHLVHVYRPRKRQKVTEDLNSRFIRIKDAAESLLATSTGNEALKHAIRAAELYMQAADGENVTKAEGIRISFSVKIDNAFIATITSPSLSNIELEILHQASHLHGSNYPIWETQPSDAEFRRGSDTEIFIDNANFTLSSIQEAHFAAWSRPQELFGSADGQDDDFMRLEKTCDLVQDVTTDCSVVASLSAATTVLTGRHSVLSTIIYPFDHLKGRPKISPIGKYVLRMNFNGCYRRVVIDDRLPASRTNRALYVIDRQNPRLIWPALLEKAYLKVRGGYDFPGSNSGTDLWVLTGWIPEQIFLQREDFDVDETWSRIKAAYEMQNVVVTLGTGQVSTEEEETMGLAGNHDYAVQDICLNRNSRSLLIKNPWSYNEGQPTATPALLSTWEQNDSTRTPPPGIFGMTIEEVAQHFESMYLNWNPGLFPHRQDRHFAWSIPPKYFHASLVRNPQFSLVSSSGGLIWILLSRHFMDAELEIARNRSDSTTADERQLGFMNISAYENQGKRVNMSDGQIYRGPYVDSPQTLARFHASPGKPYTIVVDQQELPLVRYTFTISIFSHTPVKLHEAEERMPYYTELVGVWNRRTAGGNSSCPTYFLNPQYKLCISHSSPVSILLSTDNSDIHVHVDLVWGRGERANTVRVKDLVASSGEYRRGCALADVSKLDTGTYTLACSTFEAGQTASFVLRVASAMPISLEPIPAAAAGRLRTTLAPFTLQGGRQRWRAMLSVSSLTRASVAVRTVAPRLEPDLRNGRSRSMIVIRTSVVRGHGSEQLILAESDEGEFQDSATTIRTPEFDIEPGRTEDDATWLILESTGVDHTARMVHGEIFSDSPVQITAWEVQ
ncbi:Calpain-like protease palB/cpr-8 [Cladobotryum mycophilum]|uniref:Calpain-like protease palB/cpr-8 n=1 Tax=Cladobotryum mycophilum TaxID=491253 RepID=A0ABR0S9A6_9HYPO